MCRGRYGTPNGSPTRVIGSSPTRPRFRLDPDTPGHSPARSSGRLTYENADDVPGGGGSVYGHGTPASPIATPGHYENPPPGASGSMATPSSLSSYQSEASVDNPAGGFVPSSQSPVRDAGDEHIFHQIALSIKMSLGDSTAPQNDIPISELYKRAKRDDVPQEQWRGYITSSLNA